MLTPPTLVNQIYTIGDSNKSYKFENFMVTSTPPDLCLVEYSYEISDFIDSSDQPASAISFQG